MSEATIEFPRIKPQKGPRVVPLKQWKRQQTMKKAGRSVVAAADTVLKTATAAGFVGIGTQVHQPPGIEIAHAEKHSSSTITNIKETYTDLLTKNSKEEKAARSLVKKATGAVMQLVTEPGKAAESQHLQTVRKWRDKIIEEANRNNIPPQISLALALTENSGGETKISEEGAAGIYQLRVPAGIDAGLVTQTANGTIVKDERSIPERNIEGGNWYVAKQRERFGGDLGLALIANYIGPHELLKILNNQAEHTRGYAVISSEASLDDPIGRELITNYIRINHISAFSLLDSEETRIYFGEDEEGKKRLEEVKAYVPGIIAAAEHLVTATDVIEPEKIFVTIPNIPRDPKQAQARRTDGAVL